MSSIEILQNKISTIEKYLSLLTAFRSYSENEIKENTTIMAAVERYSYLAVQATIDLAEGFISYKNFRKPASMSD